MDVAETAAAFIDMPVRSTGPAIAHLVPVSGQHDVTGAEAMCLLLPLQPVGHEGPAAPRAADGITGRDTRVVSWRVVAFNSLSGLLRPAARCPVVGAQFILCVLCVLIGVPRQLYQTRRVVDEV